MPPDLLIVSVPDVCWDYFKTLLTNLIINQDLQCGYGSRRTPIMKTTSIRWLLLYCNITCRYCCATVSLAINFAINSKSIHYFVVRVPPMNV